MYSGYALALLQPAPEVPLPRLTCITACDRARTELALCLLGTPAAFGEFTAVATSEEEMLTEARSGFKTYTRITVSARGLKNPPSCLM